MQFYFLNYYLANVTIFTKKINLRIISVKTNDLLPASDLLYTVIEVLEPKGFEDFESLM